MSDALNPEDDGGQGATYQQAKVANEMIKVQKAKVRLQKLKANLVSRHHALRHVAQLAQAERDSWRAWSRAAAVELAEQFPLDLDELRERLAQGVQAHLRELDEFKPRVD